MRSKKYTRENFFSDEERFISYKLEAKNISSIFRFYNNKHNLKLIKNGEFSKETIEKNKLIYIKRMEELNHPEFFFYFFIQGLELINYDSTNKKEAAHQCYLELSELLCSYMDSQSLRGNLSLTEISNIHEICKRYNEENHQSLVELINFEKSIIQEKIDNICLTKEQVVEEVKRIQKESQEDEVVGYLFTNNNNLRGAHFEPLIIAKTFLIKPVIWPSQPARLSLTDEDFRDMNLYTPCFEPFLDDHFNKYRLTQQADWDHCGVLSVSYLKKLLKNSSQPLHEKFLMLDFYNNKKQLVHFFFPPPCVLQYTQSLKFIKMLLLILDDSTDIKLFESANEVFNTSIKFNVFTLQSVLIKSIEFASSIGDIQTTENNRIALENLSEFRAKWLDEYHSIFNKKIDRFFDGKQHCYLNYAAKRMNLTIQEIQSKIDIDSECDKHLVERKVT